jgi:hypothetical protein
MCIFLNRPPLIRIKYPPHGRGRTKVGVECFSYWMLQLLMIFTPTLTLPLKGEGIFFSRALTGWFESYRIY